MAARLIIAMIYSLSFAWHAIYRRAKRENASRLACKFAVKSREYMFCAKISLRLSTAFLATRADERYSAYKAAGRYFDAPLRAMACWRPYFADYMPRARHAEREKSDNNYEIFRRSRHLRWPILLRRGVRRGTSPTAMARITHRQIKRRDYSSAISRRRDSNKPRIK